MQFPSLLFWNGAPDQKIPANVPDDLRITLLLPESVVPALYTPCGKDNIPLRQTMFARLAADGEQSAGVRECLKELAEAMSDVAACYDSFSSARCDNEQALSYLGLVDAYHRFCRKAAELPEIDAGDLYARFTGFFRELISSREFCDMDAVTAELHPKMDAVRYNRVRIRGAKLKVSAENPTTFEERLARCASDLGFSGFSPARPILHPIAPQIIDAVASLYPEQFNAFRDFYKQHGNYFDKDLLSYRLELDFINAIVELTLRVRRAGIPMTCPAISSVKKIDITSCYDITLLSKGETRIVPNDVLFDEEAPFFYLTGANGGGKTTYLRTVGVAVLLFLCGCPVPCDKAEIFPLSAVYTHFPRDERFDGDGRFADEKKRIAEINAVRGDDSLILLNETYATTSEEIAVEQTEALAAELYKSGCLGVYITHQHSLAQTDIPFLNVIVDSDNENRRTYKIARRKGVSGSYAHDILKKYSLTREALEARFPEAKEA